MLASELLFRSPVGSLVARVPGEAGHLGHFSVSRSDKNFPRGRFSDSAGWAIPTRSATFRTLRDMVVFRRFVMTFRYDSAFFEA